MCEISNCQRASASRYSVNTVVYGGGIDGLTGMGLVSTMAQDLPRDLHHH